MRYHIQDWTGRVLFDGKTFDTFEDGWAFIYDADPIPEDGPENYYDDYYVEVVA